MLVIKFITQGEPATYLAVFNHDSVSRVLSVFSGEYIPSSETVVVDSLPAEGVVQVLEDHGFVVAEVACGAVVVSSGNMGGRS